MDSQSSTSLDVELYVETIGILVINPEIDVRDVEVRAERAGVAILNLKKYQMPKYLNFLFCFTAIAGLLATGNAIGADFSYGEKVYVAGGAIICSMHDDIRLVDFALDKGDLAQINRVLKARGCGVVDKRHRIIDCEFISTLGPHFVQVRCAWGLSMRDLYLRKYSVVSNSPE